MTDDHPALRHPRFPLRRGLFAAAVAVAAAGGARAQVAAEGVPGDPAAGAALYARYCATCHGAGAEGDGPTAELLTVRPTDLTALSSEDGVFPTGRVVRRIDGRDPVLAHGSPMPIFGPFFEGQDTAMKTPAGQPILTSQPVVDLVAYLMTLQDE
jgi:mono/diheme cytochrome c family protein